jgi:hypothetical protein
LLDCKFLTNLNISYFLLATILFASSLGLPNPHPDLVPVPDMTLHQNVKRLDYGCDPGWTFVRSTCWSSRQIIYWCSYPGRRDLTKTYNCPPGTQCIGGGLDARGLPNAPSVCLSFSKRIGVYITEFVKFKFRGCVCFQAGSANLGIGPNDDDLGISDNTDLATLNVQVEHGEVTYPPMPELAELYYQGASFPIQSIMPQQMEMEYGSFVFNAVFDPTQPLEICVTVPTKITFDFAFEPYTSSGQGIGYKRGNMTQGDSHRRGNMTSNKADFDELTYNEASPGIPTHSC